MTSPNLPRYTPTSRRHVFRLSAMAFALITAGLISPAALAAPESGSIRAGQATIQAEGGLTLIQQTSNRAIIDWRGFSTAAGETVRFEQPSITSATLNRVTGGQVSLLLGRLDANGQILLINPHGIIFGKGAQINVGGLIASTANIDNQDFMAGRLAFSQPGQPGAAIINAGEISAAEGGLVALVAPQVRNDGIISARLGRVALAAGDTFTLDLYGDQLINLAVSDSQAEQFHVAHTGAIEAAGGKVVLVTAATGKQVLDEVINLSGVIRADTVDQQAGEVLLLGRDGNVNLGGTINADGGSNGNGGKVIIWADGDTHFTGSISARGGDAGGNGGFVEVSGKQTVDFLGNVDLAAPYGLGGSLLIDPAYLNIGLTEATLLNRILRTGASTTLQADIDININSIIDGRGRYAGGGLTLTAGNDININNYLVTNNGTVRLNAGSAINIAPGYGIFTGTGALYASSGNTLANTGLISANLLHLTSTAGNVNIATGIDAGIGNVVLDAANDVNIDQAVTNLKNGSSLTARAGNDVKVSAQIDGRGSAAGGTATLTAANDILLNQSIVTNNGAIALTSTAGTVTPAAGKGLFAGNGTIAVTTGGNYSTGIYGTTGNLTLRSTAGKLTVAETIDETVGNVSLRGQTGVDVNQGIANIRNGSGLIITADTGDINVNARIDAQDDGTISPVAGGAVTLTAGNNVNINETIVTYNGPVSVTATTGTVTFADSVGNGSGNKKIITGSGPITVTTGGNFSTGTAPPNALALTDYGDGTRYLYIENVHDDGITTEDIHEAIASQLKPWVTLSTTGKLTLTSTGGTVGIDAPIPYTTGEIEINGVGVVVNEHLVNAVNQPISINAGSSGIVVNEAISSNYDITVKYTINGTDPVSQLHSADGTTIDARNANLTLRSTGDIDINGYQVASAQTLTLDARGAIHGGGGIERSRYNQVFPQVLNLTGDAGIGSLGSVFSTGQQSDTTLVSSLGDIFVSVFQPSRLRITANTGSIAAGGWLGPDVLMNAGTDIDVRSSTSAGALTMNAGRDIKLKIMDASSISANAGQDVLFNASASDLNYPDSNYASIWLDGPGGLNVTAGRYIDFQDLSGVSLTDGNPASGPEPALTLNAGSEVTLRRLQTYGPVNIYSGGGINLLNDIGPTITGGTLFTVDKGVESLTLTTPTTGLFKFVDMEGARAVGNVVITTKELIAAKSITSTSGTVTITADTQNITAGAIGTMAEMERPIPVAPAISPGPAVSPPLPPGAIGALPTDAPGGINVAGITAPGANADSLPEIFVPEPVVDVATLIEMEPTASGSVSSDSPQQGLPTQASVNPLAFDTTTGAFLVFPGGRGDMQEEERRRR